MMLIMSEFRLTVERFSLSVLFPGRSFCNGCDVATQMSGCQYNGDLLPKLHRANLVFVHSNRVHNMKRTLDDAGREWGVVLPEDLVAISTIKADACLMLHGREVPLPWPSLTTDDMIGAMNVASDWELAPGLIPIMGDCHDLVCLRYEGKSFEEVVVINDEREILASFPSVAAFVRETRPPSSIEPSLTNSIVDEKSWLDF